MLALVKFDYVPGRPRTGAGSLDRRRIGYAEVNYQPCQLMKITGE